MPNNSSANKRIVSNTIFLTIRMVLVMCISLYTSRVFINVLGVEDYGISNLVAGFVSLFSFFNIALSNGTIRFYNFELGENSIGGITKIYNAALLIQAILAIVIILLVETIGMWYFNTKMVIPIDRMNIAFWLFQMSIVSSVIIVLQIPYSAAIMSYEKMDFYALVSIIDAVGKLGFALAIPSIPLDKLISFGLFGVILNAIDLTLYVSYCKIKFKAIHFDRNIDWNTFKKMFIFSGWSVIGTSGSIIRIQGLNLVLNFFFGPILNAARGVATQVSSAIQSFAGNIGTAVKPQIITSYAEGNIERSAGLMYSMSKVYFIVIYLFVLPISYEINYILHIWLGNAIPDHANYFTILTFIVCILTNFNAPVSDVIHATGKIKGFNIFSFTISICTIPATFLLLKKGFAPEFIFLADGMAACIMQVISLLIMKKLTGLSVSVYIQKVVSPVFFCFISSCWIPAIPVLLMNDDPLRCIIVFVVSAIAVSFSGYFFLFNELERAAIKMITKSITQKMFSH